MDTTTHKVLTETGVFYAALLRSVQVYAERTRQGVGGLREVK